MGSFVCCFVLSISLLVRCFDSVLCCDFILVLLVMDDCVCLCVLVWLLLDRLLLIVGLWVVGGIVLFSGV